MPEPVRELPRLRAVDLEQPELQFTDGKFTYVTSGKQLGRGGMGEAWLVTRFVGTQPPEVVVAKTFRSEFLISLREDELARRHFDHFERVVDELKVVSHPSLLPVLALAPIADNYLVVTPLGGPSLLATVALNKLSPRERVYLLVCALQGLSAMHRAGIVHRDFTLQNILTHGDRSVVFDFDISVAPSLIGEGERSYHAFYQGRILGAPDFSIAPELLDEVLSHAPITPRIDVYAVGTALYGLFTEQSLYGEAPDLATLFQRISEGVVHRRESRIRYADTVPPVLWPIIETCLEREPETRYADADAVLAALEPALESLSEEEARGPFRKSNGYDVTQVCWSPEELYETRLDGAVTLAEIQHMESTLGRLGYLVEQSLGRVKGHNIFLAMPDPELVGSGLFSEDNTYRKIVTAIDLSKRADADAFVELWLAKIFPIVSRVRQGFLTALFKVVHDRPSRQLLLFSEYVADPRFGTDLEPHALTLEEVFGLGLIGALSIARLHDQGLAHNNVEARSLVFKGLRDQGRVFPLFVGLVEPSFDPQARVEDVRNLATFISGLIRPSRVDALRPDLRQLIERERKQIDEIAHGHASKPPSIHVLTYLFGKALGIIDPNFELIRTHEGDVFAFADLLVRHALYNRLYQLDVSDA